MVRYSPLLLLLLPGQTPRPAITQSKVPAHAAPITPAAAAETFVVLLEILKEYLPFFVSLTSANLCQSPHPQLYIQLQLAVMKGGSPLIPQSCVLGVMELLCLLPVLSCLLSGREEMPGLNAVSRCVYILTDVCKHVGESITVSRVVCRYFLV